MGYQRVGGAAGKWVGAAREWVGLLGNGWGLPESGWGCQRVGGAAGEWGTVRGVKTLHPHLEKLQSVL